MEQSCCLPATVMWAAGLVGCWLILSPPGTMIIIPAWLIITRDEFHLQSCPEAACCHRRRGLWIKDHRGSYIVAQHLFLNEIHRNNAKKKKKKEWPSYRCILVSGSVMLLASGSPISLLQPSHDSQQTPTSLSAAIKH